MKIFRNGLCYIDSRSMKTIPDNIPLSKRRFGSAEYAIVSDKAGISYLRERRDIIDYDDICCLSRRDLDRKIDKAFESLEPYASKFLETDVDKLPTLYADKDFMSSCKRHESVYYCLLDYRNNKDKIDETISVSISATPLSFGGVQKAKK